MWLLLLLLLAPAWAFAQTAPTCPMVPALMCLAGREGGQILTGGTGGTDKLRLLGTTSGGSAVEIGGQATVTELRFLEPSATGTDYRGFKAHANVTSSGVWTLPAADSAGSLTSDGVGNLSLVAKQNSDAGLTSLSTQGAGVVVSDGADTFTVLPKASAQTITLSSDSDGTIQGGTTSGAKLTLTGSQHGTKGPVALDSQLQVKSAAMNVVTATCGVPPCTTVVSTDVYDINPGEYTHLWLWGYVNNITINGISGGTSGRKLTLFGGACNPTVTLRHGTDAGDFRLPWSVDEVYPCGMAIECTYYASSSNQWHCTPSTHLSSLTGIGAQTLTMSNTEGGTIYGGDDAGKTLTLSGSNNADPGDVIFGSAMRLARKSIALGTCTSCGEIDPEHYSLIVLSGPTANYTINGMTATGISSGHRVSLYNATGFTMTLLGDDDDSNDFRLGISDLNRTYPSHAYVDCVYDSSRWRCNTLGVAHLTEAGAQTLTLSSSSDGTINGGTTSGATLTLSGSIGTPGQVQTASGFSIGTRANLDVTGADPTITSPATVSCTEPGAGCPSSCGVCSITPGPYNHIYVVGATAAFSIDKLVGTDGTVGGRVVVINNSTAQNVTLVHGTAAGAFRLPSGSNIVLPQYGTGWCVSFASSGFGFFTCK